MKKLSLYVKVKRQDAEEIKRELDQYKNWYYEENKKREVAEKECRFLDEKFHLLKNEIEDWKVLAGELGKKNPFVDAIPKHKNNIYTRGGLCR